MARPTWIGASWATPTLWRLCWVARRRRAPSAPQTCGSPAFRWGRPRRHHRGDRRRSGHPACRLLPCRVRRERSGGVVAAVGESHCRGSSGCLCRLRTLGAHAGPRGSAERTAASRPGPRLSCSRTRRRRSSRRRADCAVALPGGQRCVCPAGATTRLHLGGSSDSRATEASRAARSRVKPGMTGAFGRLVSTSSTNGD